MVCHFQIKRTGHSVKHGTCQVVNTLVTQSPIHADTTLRRDIKGTFSMLFNIWF